MANDERTTRTAAAPQGQRPNPLDGILGNFHDPGALAGAFAKAERACNLIGALTVGSLPVGCEVAITAVSINPDPKGGTDVYDVGMGRFALSRAALDRIANAAGVMTMESTLIDYRGDYCAWRVTRQMMGLDCRPARQTCTRIIDLRPGSAYRKSLQAKARAKNRDPEGQVNEIVSMIGAHTETKARLRADRALLGIRTYTAEELRRPFVVAKLLFTGHTDDPTLKPMMAYGVMASMLSGNAALFGAPPMPTLQMPAPPMPTMPMMGMGAQAMQQGLPPALPPVDGSAPPLSDIDDEDDDDPNGAGAPDPAVLLARINWREVKSAGDFVIPIGKDKTKKISQVGDLRWYRGVLEGDLFNPDKAQFQEDVKRRLRAIYDELHNRGEMTPMDAAPAAQAPPAGGSAGAPQQSGDPGTFPYGGDPNQDGR